MKFSCEKFLLQLAVSTASRASLVKSAVPALEGLLIEANSNLTISGYDLKTGIRTSIAADISETGEIVLNARLLGEILRKLPDDTVILTVDDRYMAKIECGLSKFDIMGFPASDYPELPSVEYQSSIFVTEKILKSMISQTNFAVSDNESRPIHTGSLFEVEGNTLTVVAVDGYRLAMRREPLKDNKIEKCSFVVPGTALSEVEKIASDSEDMVTITLGAKHIMFTIGDTVLISRRLEGEFLNYKNSIPQTSKYLIEADKKSIVDSVERVSLIISDKLKSPVRCTFDSGVIKFLTTTSLGRASDECAVKGDGEGLEIGFNNKYLLEALKAAPSDKICIQLSTGVAPCIMIPADGSRNFLYMILPVRLKANES